jgi:hypothetical protein
MFHPEFVFPPRTAIDDHLARIAKSFAVENTFVTGHPPIRYVVGSDTTQRKRYLIIRRRNSATPATA